MSDVFPSHFISMICVVTTSLCSRVCSFYSAEGVLWKVSRVLYVIILASQLMPVN